MNLKTAPAQLRYWMRLRGFSRDSAFVVAVNAQLKAAGVPYDLTAQQLSQYLRTERWRAPARNSMASAIVAALDLNADEELHLRRLWDAGMDERDVAPATDAA